MPSEDTNQGIKSHDDFTKDCIHYRINIRNIFDMKILIIQYVYKMDK